MGRQDFLSVLFRSIGGELYKLRRRAMSKTLLLIAILIMIITFLLPALAALANNSSSLQVSCAGDRNDQKHCTSGSLQDIAKKVKETISAPLRLPNSLSLSVTVINFVGTISLIILTGSIMGSEYSIGTIRLMLIRGPTRTQFFLAKISVLIVCILITLFVLILVGIIVGALFNLTIGVPVNFSFFTVEWMNHAILYIFVAALGLFVYSMIAFCLATLGKTAAAGMAGALIWWFFESMLGVALTAIGKRLGKGPIGNFLQSIPDYFIGSNISALHDHQNQYVVNGINQAISTDISDLHAIIVLIVYLMVFIGIAWWVNQQRDITN
jgi:ABC-type transport system involved in multi-copper enzyme maturation permease subunit